VLLQLLVGDAQLLLLGLQLLGLALRLLEQRAQPLAVVRGPDGDGDAVADAVDERQRARAGRVHRAELDDALRGPADDQRRDDEMTRRGLAERRADREVPDGQVVQHRDRLSPGGLAGQALAGHEAVRNLRAGSQAPRRDELEVAAIERVHRAHRRVQRAAEHGERARPDLGQRQIALQLLQQVGLRGANPVLGRLEAAGDDQPPREHGGRPDDGDAEGPVGVANPRRDARRVGRQGQRHERRGGRGARDWHAGVMTEDRQAERDEVEDPHRDAERREPVGHEDRGADGRQDDVEHERLRTMRHRDLEPLREDPAPPSGHRTPPRRLLRLRGTRQASRAHLVGHGHLQHQERFSRSIAPASGRSMPQSRRICRRSTSGAIRYAPP
jgi:hypothetical protein